MVLLPEHLSGELGIPAVGGRAMFFGILGWFGGFFSAGIAVTLSGSWFPFAAFG